MTENCTKQRYITIMTVKCLRLGQIIIQCCSGKAKVYIYYGKGTRINIDSSPLTSFGYGVWLTWSLMLYQHDSWSSICQIVFSKTDHAEFCSE